MSYYIPERDGDLLNWANNVKIKLPAVGAAIGLTTGDITTGVADATDLITKIQTARTKEDEKKAAIEAKKLSKKTAGFRLAALFTRAKAMPAYTEVHGQELGII